VRVLVIEDEQKVARALREGLESEHYQVEVSASGEDGFFRAVSKPFDVIILDLMLPGRSGLEILSTLRRQGHRTPVLVLTAKDAVQDRVVGLDSGADDYLVKPFAFAELLARLRALIRRGRPAETQRLRVADLEMDLVSRQAARGGEAIELTAREFDLLEYLLRHEGELVSREMLTREVWNEPSRGTPLDNVIDVHIARVRKKIDTEGRVKLIHTVRGVGFLVKEGAP
jgi:two-component system, OmpR family, copper resistance phosphate regulon response regulator CusR